MEDFGADEHGRVSYEQFLVINKLYPRLFYPAFQVQLRLQHVTLGPAWYEKKQDDMRERRQLLQQQEQEKVRSGARRVYCVMTWSLGCLSFQCLRDSVWDSGWLC